MQRFYVYAHVSKLTNEIFYIGKGSGNRATRFKRNNKSYNEFVSQTGINNIKFCILHHHLSNSDALRLEALEISKHPALKNSVVNSTLNKLSFMQLECLFKIDETSDSGLSRIAYRPLRLEKCGTMSSDGYWYTKFDNQRVPVHRIIAVLHFRTDIDDCVVNHINGVKSCNLVTNLELCSVADNNRHARNSKNKTVYPLVSEYPSNYRVVGILMEGNKPVDREFPKTTQGLLLAKELSNSCY